MQADLHRNAVLSNLRVRLSANARAVAQTATVRVNGVDSALVASITASSTGVFEDTTHSVQVELADLINLELDSGASTSSATIRHAAVLATFTAPVGFRTARQAVNRASTY